MASTAAAALRNLAFAIEADCTGTGQAYAAQCTNFTLYSSPATAEDWKPVGASTTNLNKQGAFGSAALVLTGSRGYLLAPDGTLYAGPVTGTTPWRRVSQIPCAVGLAQANGTPAGALLGALTAQNLILSCETKAIYQSSDGGATWQQTATGPATSGPATSGSGTSGTGTSGTGTSIAANKVPGVRAALAWEPWIARNARLWNDANVLALSLKRLAPDVAVECVQAFLEVEAEDPEESASIDLIRDL